MGGAALDDQRELVGGRKGWTYAVAHLAHWQVREAVQDKDGLGPWMIQGAEEGPPPGERGGAELMREQGALEDELDRTRQRLALPGENGGHTQQHAGMDVMATGMGDTHLLAKIRWS